MFYEPGRSLQQEYPTCHRGDMRRTTRARRCPVGVQKPSQVAATAPTWLYFMILATRGKRKHDMMYYRLEGSVFFFFFFLMVVMTAAMTGLGYADIEVFERLSLALVV